MPTYIARSQIVSERSPITTRPAFRNDHYVVAEIRTSAQACAICWSLLGQEKNAPSTGDRAYFSRSSLGATWPVAHDCNDVDLLPLKILSKFSFVVIGYPVQENRRSQVTGGN